MSFAEGPPLGFIVSDVYVKVGDPIVSGQKFLSIRSPGAGGQLDLLWDQYDSTVTQIAEKGHYIDVLNNPEDWLITVE